MNAEPEFGHPLVRALAWLIGAPGLLNAPTGAASDAVVSDAWCVDALAQSRSFLAALDANPRALEAEVAACKSRRLGRIAECLIAFWIERSERFELLARNLPVRDAGRTLGEFDLVFRDLQEGAIVHWEMAVKFYLRRRRSADFLGPEGRDTLSRKAGRIFGHQLRLGVTPAGQTALAALGSGPVRSRAFVKGRLFHPEDHRAEGDQVNPGHERGWWRTLDEFRYFAPREGMRSCIVERDEWIMGSLARELGQTVHPAEAAEVIGARLAAGGRALMVAQFGGEGGTLRECARGFVVPDHWGTAVPSCTT